jgi:hypothetical protein
MIIVKPKIIGDYTAQDLTKIVDDDHEARQILGDKFFKLQ